MDLVPAVHAAPDRWAIRRAAAIIETTGDDEPETDGEPRPTGPVSPPVVEAIIRAAATHPRLQELAQVLGG